MPEDRENREDRPVTTEVESTDEKPRRRARTRRRHRAVVEKAKRPDPADVFGTVWDRPRVGGSYRIDAEGNRVRVQPPTRS